MSPTIDTLQTSQSRFRYWSFYPLLLFLMLASVAMMVRGINERQRLLNEQTQMVQNMPKILEITQLQKWIERWMTSMYQYQTSGNREEYLRQTSYYLEKITEQMASLKSKGLSSTELNQFHERLQNINLSVKSFEQAVINGKRDNELINKILLSIQQEMGLSQLLFKHWGERISEDFQRQLQGVNQYFYRLVWWQLIFSFLALIISAYLFIRLLLRWIADQRLIYQVYHQDDLDVPNVRQLIQDFNQTVVLPSTSRAAIFRLNILGQKELTRLFGTHIGLLSQKIIAQRLNEMVKKMSPPGGVYFITDQQWALLLLMPQQQSDAEVLQNINQWGGSLLDLLEKPIDLKNMTLRCSAKMGVSVYPQPASTYHLCMQQAEMALATIMYSAPKSLNLGAIEHNTLQNPFDSIHSGKIALYHASMPIEVGQRIEMVDKLRHAVRQANVDGFEGLRVVYQPCMQVTHASEWRINTRLQWMSGSKLLDIEDFRELAERSGLIIDIGDWYLQEVLRQWREWQDIWVNHGIASRTIIVSVFPRQLSDHEFPIRLNRFLQTYQVPPEKVIFSLGGSWQGLPSDQCNLALKSLKATGVGLLLADFGRGDISFSDLPQFLVDGILVHKDFVQSMQYINSEVQSESAAALMASHSLARLIINMGKDLGRWTIADGVSNTAQSTLLTLWGCQYLQGDLFAPLMSPKEFSAWVEKHHQPF